jgi:hypothetical protein
MPSHTMRRPSMAGNRFQLPLATTIELGPDHLALVVNRVPPDLANEHLPAVRRRRLGPSRWSETQDWRQWAITYGGQARLRAGWPQPERGERRRVKVTQYRDHLLDHRGNLELSVKAARDGLQRYLEPRRVVRGAPAVAELGAGLIFRDDPEHLPAELFEVVEYRAPWREVRMVIEVWR